MIILILILMLGLKLEMNLNFYVLVILDAMLWIIYKSTQLHNYVKQKEDMQKVGDELDGAIAKLEKRLAEYDAEHDQEKEEGSYEATSHELPKDIRITWAGANIAEGNITEGNITENDTQKTKDDK